MSEQERETEDEEGGTSDTAPMLPQRPLDHQTLTCPRGAGRVSQGLRTLLAGLLLHLLLPAAVFLLVLLPTAAIVYLGFLCHSRVHPAPGPRCRALLSDRGSSALIVFGFLSLPPLLVLASAGRARRSTPPPVAAARNLDPQTPPPPRVQRCGAGRPPPRRGGAALCLGVTPQSPLLRICGLHIPGGP
ncbi:Transmembrane protein 88B [Tupaia chinensis]|uniref:Transmembrane protein 88B n=1 Tax=Tupaia chinensis TaxID=246437 RepID=L8YCU8_TUPCH|nr:Transmembrane protein 88B [Tupaia chinensis]